MVFECYNICDMNKCCFYSISEDISVFDIICIRLASTPYSTHLFVFVFISSPSVFELSESDRKCENKYNIGDIHPSLIHLHFSRPALLIGMEGGVDWRQATQKCGEQTHNQMAFCIIRIQNIRITINSHDQTRSLFAKMSGPGACGKEFCGHRRHAHA